MSDETNGSNARLDRIEEDIAAITNNVRELTALALRNEFNLAQYRQASEERAEASAAMQDKTQAHLDYLTKLAGVFADRTVELEDKAKRVKDVL